MSPKVLGDHGKGERCQDKFGAAQTQEREPYAVKLVGGIWQVYGALLKAMRGDKLQFLSRSLRDFYFPSPLH